MLDAHDLTLSGADGSAALAGLTVFAHPGELLGVLGGHAAGKSALLRTLAGLARPEGGRIRLDGADITRLAAHEKSARGIVYVGEEERILGRLSVRDNLLVGAWRRRDRRAVAADLAEWWRMFPALAAVQHRRAGTLGPAERIAAALGRARLACARVLMVDEPFLRLGDEAARAGVAGALRAARDAGLIVICTFHEPADAAIADRVNVLSAGRLVFSGTPAALAAAGAAASLE